MGGNSNRHYWNCWSNRNQLTYHDHLKIPSEFVVSNDWRNSLKMGVKNQFYYSLCKQIQAQCYLSPPVCQSPIYDNMHKDTLHHRKSLLESANLEFEISDLGCTFSLITPKHQVCPKKQLLEIFKQLFNFCNQAHWLGQETGRGNWTFWWIDLALWQWQTVCFYASVGSSFALHTSQSLHKKTGVTLEIYGI